MATQSYKLSTCCASLLSKLVKRRTFLWFQQYAIFQKATESYTTRQKKTSRHTGRQAGLGEPRRTTKATHINCHKFGMHFNIVFQVQTAKQTQRVNCSAGLMLLQLRSAYHVRTFPAKTVRVCFAHFVALLSQEPNLGTLQITLDLRTRPNNSARLGRVGTGVRVHAPVAARAAAAAVIASAAVPAAAAVVPAAAAVPAVPAAAAVPPVPAAAPAAAVARAAPRGVAAVPAAAVTAVAAAAVPAVAIAVVLVVAVTASAAVVAGASAKPHSMFTKAEKRRARPCLACKRGSVVHTCRSAAQHACKQNKFVAVPCLARKKSSHAHPLLPRPTDINSVAPRAPRRMVFWSMNRPTLESCRPLAGASVSMLMGRPAAASAGQAGGGAALQQRSVMRRRQERRLRVRMT